MDASSISIWELQPDAEIPTHAWTRAYRTLPTSTTPKFPYPHATLYGQPENRPLSVRVWLDVDNGYLWTTPQTARGYDPQPDYVTQNKPNYGYDNIANTVVVRHPLTPARRALAEELLETAAPPVADYPVPPRPQPCSAAPAGPPTRCAKSTPDGPPPPPTTPASGPPTATNGGGSRGSPGQAHTGRSTPPTPADTPTYRPPRSPPATPPACWKRVHAST
ncbi:hypothetical protein ACFQX6_67480 [Streptosporangium lutulentum]